MEDPPPVLCAPFLCVPVLCTLFPCVPVLCALFPCVPVLCALFPRVSVEWVNRKPRKRSCPNGIHELPD